MHMGVVARVGLAAMTVVLFTSERAYAASLRGWGAHDAKRVAAAVVWGRYSEDDARRELATTLAWHAEQAGIKTVSCRAIAASMLEDELGALEYQHNQVMWSMAEAAEKELRENRRNLLPAANAAADIARAAQVPPELIDKAVRIALWRTRRRA